MPPTWPDSATFWQDKRVNVTGPSAMLRAGGSGFPGSFIVDKLRARGAAEVIVPRRVDYDLRDTAAIRQMFAYVHNSQLVVLHLAAHVGGIGANRAKPAEFFYDNLLK